MATDLLTPLDFNQLEAQNLRAHNLAAAPATPVTGQLYYDTDDNRLYYHNGTTWIAADGQSASGLSDNVPTSIDPDDTGSAGTGTSASRDDHQHAIVAAAPIANLTAATTNAEGSGTSFARNDHSHAITANVAPTALTPDVATAVGTNAALARADHVHNVPADAPTTTLTATTTNAEGTGTSFARNDHTHAISAALVGVISTIQPDDAAAAGTQTSFSRGDHKHAIVAAAPTGSLGNSSANAEGVATSFARSDHSHDIADDYLLIAGDTFTGNLTSNGTAKVTGLPTPTADSDAATKGYVDAASQGLDVKASVRAATTASVGTYNATGGPSGRGQLTATPNTLDGVSLAANDRVLVKDHSTAAARGIYEVTTVGTGANGVWNRATDFDSDSEVTAGAFTFVAEGTTQADTGWVLTTNDPITIGGASGTALAWSQFSGAGSIDAGAGLTKTGNTLDVGQGNGVIVQADAVTLDYGGTAELADVTKAAESAGTSAKVARADHKHDVSTAAAVGLSKTTTNAEGNATSLARSNHTHAIADDYVHNTGDTMTGDLTLSGDSRRIVFDQAGTNSDFALQSFPFSGSNALAIGKWDGFDVLYPSITIGGAAGDVVDVKPDSAGGTRYRFDNANLWSKQGNQTALAPVPNKVIANVGDGAATSFVITHNMNTHYVTVEVFRNSTPWDTVICDVERNSVDQVTVRFGVAPTTNQFSVVVVG